MDRLKKVGMVKSIRSSQVKESVWGIGFEKLDRGVFDPEKAYDKVAELGVKWIRIQSGWARTEVRKGEYEFGWLDTIVDNLLCRGLRPWMCLCYGNGLYDEFAAKVFGAVGCPPIQNEEQKQAWQKYVTALVCHYRGKINWYEVWNEPDGKWCWKHGVNGAEYGELVNLTAKAIRAADPEAKVIGGAICGQDLQWVHEMLETGAGKNIDALSYHGYFPDEQRAIERLRSVKALCLRYNPALKFIQGETGTQSRRDGSGALRGAAWTPLRQAKFLSRHMLAHRFENVLFSSYFSCMDMIEALNGIVGDKASYLDFGYFGVLGAEFDENGIATGVYTPKPSYRAFQVLASIFREEYSLTELPVRPVSERSPLLMREEDSARSLLTHGFRKPDGSCAFVYWMPSELLTTSYEATISIESCGLNENVRLIDLLDGSIYTIPENMEEKDEKGYRKFLHLPLRDYPLLLTFGKFVEETPIEQKSLARCEFKAPV